MILVGQYDSPYVRRVAISLRVLGFAYEHDTRSVFTDFDAMREINPLGRIPSLMLDDGEVLIDSAAILDWLDQSVGPERALIPPAGPERRRALRLIALATGAIDKVGPPLTSASSGRARSAGRIGSSAAGRREPARSPRWRRSPGRTARRSTRHRSRPPA
jgi:glutathione S-transferase